MMVINDSEAFLDKRRMLPQHQAALTLIQNVLENPSLTTYSWLDLCCGRGQIIANLESMINEKGRSKISYYGYDVNSDFVAVTQKKAESLGFNELRVEIGDIANFPIIFNGEFRADFISLTNTVHEINIHILSKLYIEAILRLSDNGCLFIYDMEELPKLELGAITWTAIEMQQIFTDLFSNLGIPEYTPTVARVPHKSTHCWSVQIKREYFQIDKDQLETNSEEAIQKTQITINEIIREKYENSKKMLSSLTKYGSESEQEELELQKILYDFWALSRVMEVI